MIDVRNAINSGRLVPKRSLGQCFLTDGVYAEKIIKAAELTPGDHVIEVGPGVCALTGLLCERAGTVTAVEIDRRLVAIIEAAMSEYSNFRLINADILKIPAERLLPWLRGTQNETQAAIPDAGYNETPTVATRDLHIGSIAVAQCERQGDRRSRDHSHDHSSDHNRGRLVFISNLPYYITTSIMTRLFEEFTFVDKAVLMMQREVAQKLLAAPSETNYGLLTVFAHLFCDPKKLFTVPPHCFTPQPGVESVVMSLDARNPPVIAEASVRRVFFEVARAAFARRRKTIENSLMFSGLVSGRSQADEAIARAGLPGGARGESLDVAEFAALARALSEML